MLRSKINRPEFLVLVIAFVIATLISCDKKPVNDPAPSTSSVRIGGKEYPTVTIANQIWTVANYDGAGGIAYKNGSEKPEYGRYYTFEEAKAIALPEGWRLPTKQDFIKLAESQGVEFTNQRATGQESTKKLASTTNWLTIRGTNSSGFNAHPAGYSFQNSEPIDGDICEFWMADGNTFSLQESGSGKTHTILFYSTTGTGYRFTLRFVKDK